ncbi:hypothetical protein PAMP_015514 [Pampus punctatissimus]
MRNFILITALLLCSLSWISVSASESQIVDVQSGENVTLLCFLKDYRTPTRVSWSKLVNKTEIICISSVIISNRTITFCDGFKNEKFNMSYNTSTISLKITQVDLSDSGLYFCRFYHKGHTELQVVQLNVQGHDESSDDVNIKCKSKVLLKLSIIAQTVSKLKNLDSDDIKDAALTLYSATIRSRRPASERQVETQAGSLSQFLSLRLWTCSLNLGSDNLNYAALSFHPKPKRNRRPASGIEVEPNVIYAATR